MIEQKPEAKVEPLKGKNVRPMKSEMHAFSEKNDGSMNYEQVQDRMFKEDQKKLNRGSYKDPRYV